MAAEIKFYAGKTSLVDLAGSGLGFYGSSFGASVQVGQRQDKTFITNGNGTAEGPEAHNNKYLGNTSGVSIDGGAETALSGMAITDTTLNVRFTNDSAVLTQAGELRVYDRSDINNNPSGVNCYGAQITASNSGVDSNGDLEAWSAASHGWKSLGGSGTTITLLDAPGESGASVGASGTQHDWYIALSAQPTSIGPKTDFGLYVELEYL